MKNYWVSKLIIISVKYPLALITQIILVYFFRLLFEFEVFSMMPSVPNPIGRLKSNYSNQSLTECKKIKKNWKEGMLSIAKNEIHIKSMVQSIPLYVMNCFKLPFQTCQ